MSTTATPMPATPTSATALSAASGAEVVRSAPRPEAVAALTAAFAADPIIRWLLPEAQHYLECFPAIVGTLASAAFEGGTADGWGQGAGAAVWLPPDAAPDEEAVAEALFAGVAPHRTDAVVAFLERMGRAHPDDALWYLPFIGVDPRHQGRGGGSALLDHGLARCDRDALPAYLEASSPRNRALYERHGFRVVDEIRVADSPPLWPMWRDPRR